MENRKQAHDSMPHVSRLDHAEFIMKNLESKQNLAKLCSNNNVMGVESHHQVPLNLAIREAFFKGTLLERVASLEHQLLQLCLALESSSTSTGTCGDASSSQESKSEISTFNNISYQHHKQELQLLLNTSEVQRNSKQRRKHESPVKQGGKKKPNSDEKTCKSGKKRASPNWPRFKLLG
ncbi:hypothetical protein Ddye_001074 [Dipteronia dyeriana]|uniref:Uncharacterized protein n=1 Tax=Dipteronia dyeriana TaxID=168575 RepID=A0AAE0CSZ0_9ROSI|nr:hypothetical protein Ddye_001074 [Dipteronia dyeriana]